MTRYDYPGTDLLDYPFPLRPDLTVKLTLPGKLTLQEVKRIEAFLLTLAADAPDCEAAHGPAVNGCCPRCGGPVRVVGFQSCECGREQIEQLAPVGNSNTRGAA